MDRPCGSSWTGAHEIFQAEEYDAGASLTHQESQHIERKDSWTVPAHILKHWKLLRRSLNEVIKEAHLYCKGDLEPLSSRP
jgi:hypothetical protein